MFESAVKLRVTDFVLVAHVENWFGVTVKCYSNLLIQQILINYSQLLRAYTDMD